MLSIRHWARSPGKAALPTRHSVEAHGWVAGLGKIPVGAPPGLGPDAVVHRGDGWIIAGTPEAAIPIEGMRGGIYRAVAECGSGGSEVVLDLQAHTLTASADPFGLSGCYWQREGETVWYASKPRLLPGASAKPLRVDPVGLHGYLCFSHVPQPRAIHAGVSIVPAGGSLVLRPEEPAANSGRHEWRERPGADTEAERRTEVLRGLLRAAVEQCLGGETEAAVFLSGGLDSSLVAAMLVEAGVKAHLFTLDFGRPWNLELAFAEQVARHLGQPLHVVPAGPEAVREHLAATAAALDQPFGDAVTVPLYLLGKAASQVGGLVFNGEGGDQLFGGWANKPMIAAELYGGPGYDRLDAYMATFHRFWGLTDSLYTPEARQALAGVDARDWVRSALEASGCRSLLHKLRAANLALKGAQNIAPRAVQLGTCHGLRVRCPFFDRTLADWTFSLPPEVFLQGACEKYLLKQVAEQYLPTEVVWREKRGMGVPSVEWCLGPLKREIRHYLGRPRLQRDGWFEPRTVETLCRGVDQPGEFRSRRLGEKLWLLLMLHVWMDQHGARPAHPQACEPRQTGTPEGSNAGIPDP